MDERLAPKAAAEINRDAKRRKSSSEPKGEDSEIVEQRVDEENGVTDAELTPEQDDQGTVHGEHHILDVKVFVCDFIKISHAAFYGFGRGFRYTDLNT